MVKSANCGEKDIVRAEYWNGGTMNLQKVMDANLRYSSPEKTLRSAVHTGRD
jgi:hypothetical protein